MGFNMLIDEGMNEETQTHSGLVRETGILRFPIKSRFIVKSNQEMYM